jgi:hypothetical protein
MDDRFIRAYGWWRSEGYLDWLRSPPGRFYLTPRAYLPAPAAVRMLTDPAAWLVPGVVPANQNWSHT